MPQKVAVERCQGQLPRPPALHSGPPVQVTQVHLPLSILVFHDPPSERMQGCAPQRRLLPGLEESETEDVLLLDLVRPLAPYVDGLLLQTEGALPHHQDAAG